MHVRFVIELENMCQIEVHEECTYTQVNVFIRAMLQFTCILVPGGVGLCGVFLSKHFSCSG